MREEEVVKMVSDISKLRKTILDALLPEEAQRHFHSSWREALLGVNAVIQHAIDRHDEQANDKAPLEKSSKSKSIEIT